MRGAGGDVERCIVPQVDRAADKGRRQEIQRVAIPESERVRLRADHLAGIADNAIDKGENALATALECGDTAGIADNASDKGVNALAIALECGDTSGVNNIISVSGKSNYAATTGAECSNISRIYDRVIMFINMYTFAIYVECFYVSGISYCIVGFDANAITVRSGC